jgi:hypothetical protein
VVLITLRAKKDDRPPRGRSVPPEREERSSHRKEGELVRKS